MRKMNSRSGLDRQYALVGVFISTSVFRGDNRMCVYFYRITTTTRLHHTCILTSGEFLVVVTSWHTVRVQNWNDLAHKEEEKWRCAGGRHNMPPPLQVDLWPFDLEGGVRATCDVGYIYIYIYIYVPILVFLGLSVLDLGLMYATDVRRQTHIIA